MGERAHDTAMHTVRNALLAQIQSAQTELDRGPRMDDDAVHSARKDLKAARAALRLLRNVIGERRYVVENARLRNAARPLSRVRDAKILRDTADRLLKNEKNRRDRRLLLDLTGRLRRERKALRGEVLAGAKDVKASLSTLVQSGRNIARWPLRGPKDALPSALERLYRRSRKAMRHAQEHPSDDTLHEARKQAKYLALALETLGATGKRETARSVKRATAIGDQVGTDHDLSLIQSRLRRLPHGRTGKELPPDIPDRRAKLQHKAFRNGERLYRERPRSFVKRNSIL